MPSLQQPAQGSEEQRALGSSELDDKVSGFEQSLSGTQGAGPRDRGRLEGDEEGEDAALMVCIVLHCVHMHALCVRAGL